MMRYVVVLFYLVTAALLAGCSGGAVVFAPTPAPPDTSPLRYEHPSGAFSLIVPRQWSVYTQNITTLASAAFAPPDRNDPLLLVSVMKPAETLDSTAFGEFIDQYQTQIRPDLDRYTEQNRQAMGDGSWRLTGLRLTPGGYTEAVNTFIERSGSLVGIIEAVLAQDPAQIAELQTIVNTFALYEGSSLEGAPISALTFANEAQLDILHISTWTTPQGIFFITGEIANYGGAPVADVPVRAVLRTADDLPVAEAVDIVMGHGIPPGGFAPFSLRFGQGQPALTSAYELFLGGDGWQPSREGRIYGQESLSWTDESQIDGGRLVITGTVTNNSSDTIRELRAIVTVFDATQRVIAAAFAPVDAAALAPAETASFQLVIAEMGGQPASYIVNVQGLP